MRSATIVDILVRLKETDEIARKYQSKQSPSVNPHTVDGLKAILLHCVENLVLHNHKDLTLITNGWFEEGAKSQGNDGEEYDPYAQEHNDFVETLRKYAPSAVERYAPSVILPDGEVGDMLREKYARDDGVIVGLKVANYITRFIQKAATQYLPNAGSISEIRGGVEWNTIGHRPCLNIGVMFKNYPRECFAVYKAYVDKPLDKSKEDLRPNFHEIVTQMKKLYEDFCFEKAEGYAHRDFQLQDKLGAQQPQIIAVQRILNRQNKLVGLVLSDGKQTVQSPVDKCIQLVEKGGIKNVKAVTRNGKTFLMGNGISLESLQYIMTK